MSQSDRLVIVCGMFFSFVVGVIIERLNDKESDILSINVSSPYNPEDGLIWRTLEDAAFACFPIED